MREKRQTLFLDANIFFAASCSPTGGSAQIFLLAQKRKVHLVSSIYVLNEVKRNLRAKKSEQELIRFYHLVSSLMRVDPKTYSQKEANHWESVLIAKDIPGLLSAEHQKVDVLVTLDRKDFMNGKMKKLRLPFQIQTPGEWINSLL